MKPMKPTIMNNHRVDSFCCWTAVRTRRSAK